LCFELCSYRFSTLVICENEVTENAFWFLVRFTTKRSINLNTGLRPNFAVWIKLYTLLAECSSRLQVKAHTPEKKLFVKWSAQPRVRIFWLGIFCGSLQLTTLMRWEIMLFFNCLFSTKHSCHITFLAFLAKNY